MNTSSRLPGWTAGWILAVRMASSCIACCIFHIISIPFNCSDTALRVTDAKIGPKVKIFVFRYVCFVSRIWRQNSSQDLWPFLISETRLKFLIWTQSKIHPGNRASPVNRVHMKRPLVASFYCICLPKSVLKAYTDSSQAFYLPFPQLKRSFPFRFFLSFFLPLIPRDFSLVLIVT